MNQDPNQSELDRLFSDPWRWISNMFFTVVYVGGAVVLGVVLLAAILLFTDLYRVFF